MDLFRLAQAIRCRACPAFARMRPTLGRRGAGRGFGADRAQRGARRQDQQSDRRFRRPRQDHRPIIPFEVAINETVQFGALQITPRVCYSRPPTDAPQTDTFAQVDEIDEKKQIKRIFSGWMFADSPGPARRRASDFRYLAHGLQRRHGGDSRYAGGRGLRAKPGRKSADRPRSRCGGLSRTAGPPPQPAKKKKPKPPTVVAAPAPDAEPTTPFEPAPNPSSTGNARAR